MKSVLSKHSGGKADHYVDDGDKLKFGHESLEVRTTPGHTDGKLIGRLNVDSYDILD
ncbi:hypothetical protein COOONC_26065 [Cooperia oncophora]